jgi:hypothetical protein
MLLLLKLRFFSLRHKNTGPGLQIKVVEIVTIS